jgi:hypothetical protein
VTPVAPLLGAAFTFFTLLPSQSKSIHIDSRKVLPLYTEWLSPLNVDVCMGLSSPNPTGQKQGLSEPLFPQHAHIQWCCNESYRNRLLITQRLSRPLRNSERSWERANLQFLQAPDVAVA